MVSRISGMNIQPLSGFTSNRCQSSLERSTADGTRARRLPSVLRFAYRALVVFA
jgi:hypothetical protein